MNVKSYPLERHFIKIQAHLRLCKINLCLCSVVKKLQTDLSDVPTATGYTYIYILPGILRPLLQLIRKTSPSLTFFIKFRFSKGHEYLSNCQRGFFPFTWSMRAHFSMFSNIFILLRYSYRALFLFYFYFFCRLLAGFRLPVIMCKAKSIYYCSMSN